MQRYGNDLEPTDQARRDERSWSEYWGDAIVIVALAALAYLLPALAWDAFHLY